MYTHPITSDVLSAQHGVGEPPTSGEVFRMPLEIAQVLLRLISCGQSRPENPGVAWICSMLDVQAA